METGNETSTNGSKTNSADKRSSSKAAGRRFSRRQVLKMAGVGSIGAGVRFVPSVAAGSGDSVEIVTLVQGDCPAERREVPERWYNHTKRSRNAKRGLQKGLQNSEGIHSISRGRQQETIGELTKHNITVRMSSDRDADDIPEQVDGIPVNIERGDGIQPTSNCDNYYNKEPSDTVYGGLHWDTDLGCGTLCCRVQWYNNGSWDKYLLSARHIYTGEFCDHNDPNGNDWNQYDDTVVGTCVKEWQKYDSVLLDLSATDRDYSRDMVDESGTVVGRVTQDGLDCFKSQGTTLHKRGIATGAESGEITSTSGNTHNCTFNDNINGVVYTNINTAEGDSGGPTYYRSDSGALYLAMMNNGEVDGGSTGVSAAHLDSNENLWFGGNTKSGSC